jgi:hypothetical protein
VSFKKDHLAHRWVFDQDPLGYHLMMAILYADQGLRESLLGLMTEEQRTMARRAKDGSWKRL